MSEEITDYKVTITKEELSSLPMVVFDGQCIVVDKTEDVAAAVDELRRSNVVGFDTETRPSFHKGQTNKVSLLQLSTESKCFLFRLKKIGLTAELKSLLEDETVTKVGVSIHDDFHNLNKLDKLNPANFVELQKYVKEFKIADNSLQRIYAILFGERISKSQRLTNWESEQLSPAQIHYAALDAVACVGIFYYLKSGAFRSEKSSYRHSIESEEIGNII